MVENSPISNERNQFTADAFAHFSSNILGFIQSKVHNRAIAEDILSEVFLGVLKHETGYDPRRGPVKTWLFTIARNKIADAARQGNRRPQEYLGAVHNSIQTDQNIEEEAITRERLAEVRSAFTNLLPQQQEIIVQRYSNELTFEEAAKHEKIPVGTAKSRERLALKKLRKVLEPST